MLPRASMSIVCVPLLLYIIQASVAVDVEEDQIMKRTLPAYTILLHADRLDDSTSCKKDLETLRDAIDRHILWGTKVLDSSGISKPGFIYGNNYWLGIRSQCLDTMNRKPFVLKDSVLLNNSKYRNVDEEFAPFKVHYFVAYFRHNSTLQYHIRVPNEDLITLGLCLPMSCSISTLTSILEDIFKERALFANNLYSADFKLLEVKDLINDNTWLLNGNSVVIVLALFLACVMCVAGTAYDLFVNQKRLKATKNFLMCENNNTSVQSERKREPLDLEATSPLQSRNLCGRILLCFSVYSNTKTIFKTKLGENSVPAIHGLKLFGMMWIILVHSNLLLSDVVDNKAWSWREAETLTTQIISNSTLSVDTFFVISGFLLSFLYFQTAKTERSINHKSNNNVSRPIKFLVAFFKRFIRFTPPYMMTIGIVELNSTWYSKTSQFYMSIKSHELCEKYWWRNILYINNFFNDDTMCLFWSWYLSSDMQFFLIGMFLLLLSSTYFIAVTITTFALLLGSIFISGYISYINAYVPTMDEQYNTLNILYYPPWMRIGPYMVGIIAGYILVKLKDSLHLKRKTIIAYWCLGSICNLSVLFGLWKRHIPVLSAAIYTALSRTVWAIGISWIIFACAMNYGGPIEKFLSFKGWIPLSKLTYCAYLLNPFIISSIYLFSETEFHVEFLTTGTIFLGCFTATYIVSYGLSVMLEVPFIKLTQQFLSSNGRNK